MCSVQVGLVQMSMERESSRNRVKAGILIEAAAKEGAKIICLPELFSTKYFCADHRSNDEEWLETTSGTTASFLSDVARRWGVIIVGGSIYEKDGAKRYNTSLIFGPRGDQIAKYRKVHIPQDEGFFEQEYFTPGDIGYVSADTDHGNIGVLICYDQWFPEAARLTALKGAQMIFYPTAIGYPDHATKFEGDWEDAWESVQRGHAIANSVVVAGVNRVGTEGKTKFWGNSFISSAFGTIIGKMKDEEGILVREVDLDHGSKIKTEWGFMRNRRPATYKGIVG